MSLFLSVIGLVMIVEGFPYFCFPENIKAVAEKIRSVENSFLRLLGLALMLGGLLAIYIGRKILA